MNVTPLLRTRSWHIVEGPDGAGEGLSGGAAWSWRLRRGDGVLATVFVRVGPEALTMSREQLPARVSAVLADCGRSEVQAVCDSIDPPRLIDFAGLASEPRRAIGRPLAA